MYTQALVLKIFPHHMHSALVLDEKYGKVYAQLAPSLQNLLCHGMIIQRIISTRSSEKKVLITNIDPLYAPFSQALHDIEFLHKFLFALQQTIPLHAPFVDIIKYTRYIYDVFEHLEEFQKKMVLLYICLKADIFPEDPWLYRLIIEHAYGVHEIKLQSNMQQKVLQAFAMCWQQISTRKIV